MIVVHILSLAQAIGVHRNTIRNWVKNGKIEARPGPGKGLQFSADAFARLCHEYQLDPQSLKSREVAKAPALSALPARTSVPGAIREERMPRKVIGSVLVAGGGSAGLQAALDLADSGYYVYLVEKRAGIGGKMAQLDKTYPTNDCAM